MADPLNQEIKINEGQTDNNGAPTRSEQRYEELVGKLKEKDTILAAQKEESERKILEAQKIASEAKFDADLLRNSSKFPEIEKHKDAIKSYTDKGLTVEEAARLVIGTATQMNQDAARRDADSSSFGGSTASVGSTGQRDPSAMTQAERRAELDRMEREGNFGFKEGAMFVKDK